MLFFNFDEVPLKTQQSVLEYISQGELDLLFLIFNNVYLCRNMQVSMKARGI